MSVIQKLAFQGIPDKPGLRSIYWKLLLGFLPRQQSQWDSETKKQRQVYQDWVQELILDPHQKYVNQKQQKITIKIFKNNLKIGKVQGR